MFVFAYLASDFIVLLATPCLLYTSDAADERSSVDLGGRRIIKKKTQSSSADGRRTDNRQDYQNNDTTTEPDLPVEQEHYNSA